MYAILYRLLIDTRGPFELAFTFLLSYLLAHAYMLTYLREYFLTYTV